MAQIYLDFNASTPLAPSVIDAMAPWLSSGYGNPSSHHWAGEPARRALDDARSEVATLLEARPDDVVFTSGGSEANNLALKGMFFSRRDSVSQPHIVTTAIEHPAVVAPCSFLEHLGARITQLPVDATGHVDPDDVQRAVTTDTVLISVMHANNEVGSVQPIAEIGVIARAYGIPFHTDAAQSVGKIATSVETLNVDLLSLAGHKLYAPKGIGALYVRGGLSLEPLVHGAAHERGRRAGTESVLLAVGLGAACRLAREQPCAGDLRRHTSYFWNQLQDACGDRVVLNGHPSERLPNTLNVSFLGEIGDDVLARLEGIAASTGSACHSGSHVMSPVLEAMGRDPAAGLGAIRFSLGRTTTPDEIDTVVHQLRALGLGRSVP